MKTDSQKTVLIIDDAETSLDILVNILSDDYIVSIAMDGKSGIEAALKNPPDLILLDIIMPEMDGYQVCQELKNNQKTKDIPIIFVTALEDSENEALGLDMGAVDYITKPFSESIVKARIINHLLIKDQHDKLKNSISLIRHEAEILQHKADLGIQAGCLAHDLNNILFMASLINFIPEQLPVNLKNRNEILDDLNIISGAIQTGMEICQGYTNYLRGIGEDAKSQSVEPLLDALDMYSKQFKGRLIINIADDIPPILCKGYQLKRVFINLFVNALQALEQTIDPLITLRLWHECNRVFFSINDNGPGIEAGILPHIFDEGFTTKKKGTGLGMFLVRTIVIAHEGSVEIDTSIGAGTTVTLSFPASIR